MVPNKFRSVDRTRLVTFKEGFGALGVRLWVASAAVACLVASCTTEGGDASPDGDGDGDGGGGGTTCTLDHNDDPDTASSLATSGAVTSGTFCPRADRDFYRVAVSAPASVVVFDIRLESLSNARLALDWWGPQGLCVARSPESCSADSACGPDGVCDRLRHACRAVDEVACADDSDCEGTARCAVALKQLSQSIEAPGTGSKEHHRLQVPVAAPFVGEYFANIYDQTSQEERANIQYTVAASTVADPDTHEPNDEVEFASDVTSGAEVQGSLATVDDVDVFRIEPTNGTPPVVTVELRWPAGQANEPTFALAQAGWKVDAPSARDEAGQTRARRATFVVPEAATSWLTIQRASGSASVDSEYTLTVTARNDQDEGAARNDLADTATDVDLGGSGVVVGPDSHLLIAQNDSDWYRLTPNSSSQNSLVYLRLSASDGSESFVLRSTFFIPTGDSCDANGACAQVDGGPGQPRVTPACVESRDICIKPWVQRPNPLGPGNPQEGGLSVNHIETQLPIFAGGELYLLVEHNDATTLLVPGFSDSTGYTLYLEHKAEPDAADTTASITNFIAQPVDLSDGVFTSHRSFQTLPATCTGCGAGPGGGVVEVASGTVISLDSAGLEFCTPVVFESYDSDGSRSSGTVTASVALSRPELSLVDSCGAAPTPTSGVTLVDGTVTAGIRVAAGATAGDVVVQTSGSGLMSADSTISVLAAPASALSFVAPASRLLPVGAMSSGLTIRLPRSVTQPTPITVVFEPAGSVQQIRPSNSGFCVCGDTCSSACDVSVSARGTDTMIYLRADAPGLVTVTASAAGLGVTTLHLLAYTPAVLSQSPPAVLSGEGYISYEGDQDWFAIDVTGFPKSSVRMEVSLAGGPLDLRYSVRRGDRATGLGRHNDTCEEGCDGGSTCDSTRQTCTGGGWTRGLDPASDCSYLPSTANTLYIWFNDVWFNDWDEVRPYRFRVELVEGCYAGCTSSYCAQ